MTRSQHVRLLSKITILAGTAMLVLALSSLAQAQQRFKTPEEAVQALVNAARSGDSKSCELLSPLRGFPLFLARFPWAYAHGYMLSPLRG